MKRNAFKPILASLCLMQCDLFTIIVGGGKPEGRGPFEGPNHHRWEYNIKMDIWEVGCWDMDWNDLVRDRDMFWAVVNAVMNIRVS
jgi:hypothetical protein